MAKFFALGAILSLILTSVCWATDNYDGLVFMVSSEGGYGQGFVVGNKLVAPAHSLEHEIQHWLVVQNGKLVDISHMVQKPYAIHSKYNDLPKGVPFNDNGKVMLNAGSDVGVVGLSQTLPSNFTLETAATFDLLASRQNSEWVSDDFFVVSVDGRDPNTRRQFQAGLRPIDPKLNAVQLPGPVGPIAIKFDSNRRRIHLDGHDSSGANVIVEDGDLLTERGQSGMPLFARAKSGKLVVIGMFVVQTDLPDYPYGSNPHQNLFVFSGVINNLIALPGKSVAPINCIDALTGHPQNSARPTHN